MQNNEHRTKNQKTKLPSDPNKAMQEMMSTIDLLRHKMVEETDALNEANTALFMDLQDEKIEISRLYLDSMQDLLSRKDELKNADPSLKDRLEAARADFAVITKNNLAALEKMGRGMKCLEERIMVSARKSAKEQSQFAYGSNGHFQEGLKSSIGINESA